MHIAPFSRALGLGVTAALVTSAFPLTSASAAAPLAIEIRSIDGPAFQPSDYASGDITVQAVDSGTGADADADDALDVRYTWTITPFGSSTPVTVPASGQTVQSVDTAGAFVVALPGAQGPGTYRLDAELTDAGNTAVSSTSRTFTIGNAAPAGSTAVVSGLGAGKPGLAQQASVVVTDGQGAPISGQVFTLSLDHGFFTDGSEATVPVAGAMAGDLKQDGTTLTTTTDAAGRIDFEVGIGRDASFDDDGATTTTATVTGVATSGSTASWSTANPLNGGVAIRLSPASEQDGPVAPTLAGKRTFYDVFAIDQFGNPVAKNASLAPGDDGSISIDLRYTGNTDDYDYSDDDAVADLDLFGDIWLLSNEAGTITVTGTWAEAPTYRFDAGLVPVADVADARGSVDSTTYELNFAKSSFSMASSAHDTVRVGTAVTQTVRVIDQRGNPVEGYQVRFLRYGPDNVRGDVVATRTTNSIGRASYSFIGTRPGRATVTAEVSDGVRRREVTGTVAFGRPVAALLARTKGSASGSGPDRLTVTTRPAAPGARVDLYRIIRGKQIRIAGRTLDRTGTVRFTVRDRNRSSRTAYVAYVRSTATTVADRSNVAKLR